MILSAIVAASDNDVIGNKGRIPWKLAADSAFAKNKTMGHPLIMGSKTHDAIGRILPGRTNIVISRRPDYKAAEGAVVVGSIDEALALKEVKDTDETFIFGGQKIYELAMPRLEKIYLTRVHATVDGDAFFKYDPLKWQEVSRNSHPADDKNQYSYDFVVLQPK
jgi:dihydrofolate reductase